MAGRALVRGGAIAAVVALTGGAWIAGRQVRSPAEAAATAEPPAPSRITAPVEERVLESTVIVRGIVRYGDPRPVTLAASALKAGVAARTLIVSEPAQKGRSVAEGDVALSVGGRPVFVFQGRQPAFRDLRPGDEGTDVAQLEAALDRLGFEPGAVDGRYDDATERAVERAYRAAGRDPFGPTDQQKTQLRSARSGLATAEDTLAAARRTLDQATRSSRGERLLAAEEQLAAARDRSAAARDEAARSGARTSGELEARRTAVDLATRALTLAEGARDRARRDLTDTAPTADAADALATARSQLRQARAALEDAEAQVPLADAALSDANAAADLARSDLARARTSSPTTIAPSGLIVVLDDTQQVRAAEAAARQAEAAQRQAQVNVTSARRAVDARRAAVDDAQRAVTRAEAAVGRAGTAAADRTATVAEADQRVASATADLDRARRELVAAEEAVPAGDRSATAAVRQADAAVGIAEAQLRAVRLGSDVAAAGDQVRSAERTRKRAADELAELEGQVGVSVPADEVLFFPSLPLRVDDTKLQRGDVVTGPVMTVTTDRLAVDTSVDTVEAKLIRVGSKAVIESNEFDVTLEGTVSEIAATAGTKGVDPGKVYVEVTPDQDGTGPGGTGAGRAGAAVSAADLNGASVKVTIPVRSTGTAVLAVPVAAVSVAGDGSSRVEVEDDPAGPTRLVTVRTGLSAEGFVAVTPVGGRLRAGDQVVVGNRDGSALAGSDADAAEPVTTDPVTTDPVTTDPGSATTDAGSDPGSGTGP